MRKMKYTFSNPKLTPNARTLRKNMTRQERKLWYECLRELSYKFRRQHVVGRYILDFYCAEKMLAIEIDGSQHYKSENEIKDAERTRFLNDNGITVLRYSNLDVDKYFFAVCEDICKHLNEEKQIDFLP